MDWSPFRTTVCLGLAWLLAACEPPPVQKQFKVVERWSSRWCADSTHERLDRCEYSDSLNKLAGTVAALGKGDGRPPLRIDRGEATRTCLAQAQDAVADINPLLERGARVVVRGESMARYVARTQPGAGATHYHRIECHYRQVILEGPPGVISPPPSSP
jgi:hypothetical protein